MDRRQFKVVHDTTITKGKHGPSHPKHDDGKVGRPNLQVLQELGNQLQVKAEKMRLLAKAEEGSEYGDFNPYSTVTMSPGDKPQKTESLIEVQKDMTKPDEVKRPLPMPPSMARKKRRDQKSKIPSTNPSTVDIKQYRPGYTWNKGGRMKELRIRHIARKSLRLWKLKVFGRVTPSQAVAHYKRRLMKKCYRAWHTEWWELRKEWRLVVRAECHHRFVLFTKTFRAWKEFIVTQRIKNTKIVRAEKHASSKFQRKCFDAWVVYVKYRREKTKQKQEADGLYSNCLLRKYWSHWISQHELYLHRQHIEVVALQFWAYRLQAQHWLIWQHKMSMKKKLVQDHYKAIRHHNTVIARQCLKAWVQYWARRRQKIQEKVFAERVYKRVLIHRCFNTWLESLQFRQALYERQGMMTELAEMFQKRRMFVHWKHYIDQVHEERDLVEQAEGHYRKKLLTAGFSAFRLSVVQKKLKLMRNEMADQLRYKQLIYYGWRTWMLRCEDKEELQIVVQSQRARKQYKLVTLRKCLYQLFNYAVWRKHRQAQYARADAHFYMTEMPKRVFAWKIFVQLMKNKRENSENCVEFRRENLFARFFYTWVREFEASRENRMNERMAILHYDSHLARRFFSTWKQKTEDIQLELENEEIAIAHYHEVLRQNHLKAWKLYIVQLKQSQRQEIEASIHCSKMLTKKCLKAWIQYTLRRRRNKEKNVKARLHYQRVVCRKMVSMWLHYVDMQRYIYQRAERMYHRQCQATLRCSFFTWRNNVTDQISERNKELLGEKHSQIVILSKVFKSWHRFAAIHAYKKSETRQWVLSAQEYLNNKILAIYFDKWKRSYDVHRNMRMKYEKAVTFHQQKVKQAVIVQWKYFTQESIRITLLEKQSDWFLGVRLKARYFIAWKHALTQAETEKEKTNLALWHWCLTLHRKVLIAWFSYTQHRKHKKALVAAAMERRRKRLLKEGVSKWLCVADDLSAMRKNFAVQQNAKSAYDSSRRALKIGLRWKHWAARRGQQRSLEIKDTPRSLEVKDTPRSQLSMATLYTERGGDSCKVTPRSAVSVPVTFEVDKQRELKMNPVQLPGPTQTVSPGRPQTAVSRIHTTVEPDRAKVQQRARPRRPDFLVESLKRAGLFSPGMVDRPYDIPSHNPQTADRFHGHNTQTERQVEKLNLSNLVSNPSLVSTDRSNVTLTQRSDDGVVGEIPFHKGQKFGDRAESGRSVQSESQVIPQPGWVSDKGTNMLYTESDNTNNDIDATHPPQGWVSDKGRNVLYTDNTNNDIDVNYDSTMPKQTNIHLMTPADFLGKNVRPKPGSIQQITCDSETVSIASQSVASTPRILCQISDHGHPLSETRSFQVTDFRSGEMTPRSTSSFMTPREQLSSLGFDTDSSSKTIEREIVSIRNRLKLFEQKKKKLRTMQKQLKQLSDWLRDLEVKGQSSEDADVVRAKQEIEELTMDISMLKTSVEKEKIECTGLVDRVKILMSQLTTS